MACVRACMHACTSAHCKAGRASPFHAPHYPPSAPAWPRKRVCIGHESRVNVAGPAGRKKSCTARSALRRPLAFPRQLCTKSAGNEPGVLKFHKRNLAISPWPPTPCPPPQFVYNKYKDEKTVGVIERDPQGGVTKASYSGRFCSERAGARARDRCWRTGALAVLVACSGQGGGQGSAAIAMGGIWRHGG